MNTAILLLLLLLLDVTGVIHCVDTLQQHYHQPPNHSAITKQPVIIDTDIGSFIDDSFAIVYAIQSQELDVKLIVTCTDDTTARAKVTAKLLKLIGRDDIPIGIGIKNTNKTNHYLFDWARNEDLSAHKGGVFADGIGKMAEVLSGSDEVVDIIAIGPMTNFPSLVQKYPESVKKARIRAMAGSIKVGYNGSQIIAPEYNVALCPWCMEVLLTSGWNVTITPLDTCGSFELDADEVKHMLEADNKAALALVSTLTYFCIVNESPGDECHLKVGTPVLYDVVATLLAVPKVAAQFLEIADLDLQVNGTGFTVVDNVHGVRTSVALQWSGKGERQFANVLSNLYSL